MVCHPSPLPLSGDLASPSVQARGRVVSLRALGNLYTEREGATPKREAVPLPEGEALDGDPARDDAAMRGGAVHGSPRCPRRHQFVSVRVKGAAPLRG